MNEKEDCPWSLSKVLPDTRFQVFFYADQVVSRRISDNNVTWRWHIRFSIPDFWLLSFLLLRLTCFSWNLCRMFSCFARNLSDRREILRKAVLCGCNTRLLWLQVSLQHKNMEPNHLSIRRHCMDWVQLLTIESHFFCLFTCSTIFV